MSSLRVAACQIDPKLGEVEANLERISAAVTEAAAAGCNLHRPSRGRGDRLRLRLAGGSASRGAPRGIVSRGDAGRAGRDASVHHHLRQPRGSRTTRFSTSRLSPLADGRRYRYRKMHLPFLGIDRFATPGPDAPAVIEADGLRFGVLICYDLRFPEAARICSLEGADLIALPTNWPVGVPSIRISSRRRARRRTIATCSPATGWAPSAGPPSWVDRSCIDPDGQRLAVASDTDEETLLGRHRPRAGARNPRRQAPRRARVGHHRRSATRTLRAAAATRRRPRAAADCDPLLDRRVARRFSPARPT